MCASQWLQLLQFPRRTSRVFSRFPITVSLLVLHLELYGLGLGLAKMFLLIPPQQMTVGTSASVARDAVMLRYASLSHQRPETAATDNETNTT